VWYDTRGNLISVNHKISFDFFKGDDILYHKNEGGEEYFHDNIYTEDNKIKKIIVYKKSMKKFSILINKIKLKLLQKKN
jgi:hypothetical protein